MPTHAANADLRGRPPIRRVLGRPKVSAFACIAVLAAAGWIYLGLILAGQTAAGGILQALCQPLYGVAGSSGVAALSLTFAMWCAMALAMMLPTAGPMILTYADIAEAAAAKGEPVASPFVLTAGYTVVWLGAALVLAATQGLLARSAALDDTMSLASPLLSGALFLAAGFYQFSAMKRACLTQCQHPFTFLLANWTPEPRGVFRLGVRQGLYCLGCCWAMMVLMFAVGVMSVIWMALLGTVMAIEKVTATMRFSRIIGAVFLAIGLAIVATSAVAHWPAKIG
jgi:predicted metal-binding membrane protein